MTELVDPEDPAAGLAAVVALRRLADRLARGSGGAPGNDSPFEGV